MNEDAQMKIRLPRELKGQIARDAKANNRTMNGEIVGRLQKFMDRDTMANTEVQEEPKGSGTVLNVGASRIRKIIETLDGEDRMRFIRLIWPELSDVMLVLLATHPNETKVNGATLTLPSSWKTIEEKTCQS